MKKLLHFFAGASIPVGIFALAFAVLWLKDIRHDRIHTVTVKTVTPVFVGSGEGRGCTGTRLTTVEPGLKLPVRRIHYLKDCATLDVVLPDGRKGYVILGLGDVAVSPPLPTT